MNYFDAAVISIHTFLAEGDGDFMVPDIGLPEISIHTFLAEGDTSGGVG